MTLMLRPEAFAEIYAAGDHGLHLDFGDPTLLPRFIHFLPASVALTRLALTLLGRHWERTGLGPGAWTRERGVRLFAVATSVQGASGVWLLLSLRPEVRGLFLGDDAAATAALGAAVGAAVAALAVIRRHLAVGLGAVGVTLAGMAYVRHRVRDESLLPHFTTDALPVQPQTAVAVIFFLALVAGLAVVAWMVSRLARQRSG